jgi:hypothetical protein
VVGRRSEVVDLMRVCFEIVEFFGGRVRGGEGGLSGCRGSSAGPASRRPAACATCRDFSNASGITSSGRKSAPVPDFDVPEGWPAVTGREHVTEPCSFASRAEECRGYDGNTVAAAIGMRAGRDNDGVEAIFTKMLS